MRGLDIKVMVRTQRNQPTQQQPRQTAKPNQHRPRGPRRTDDEPDAEPRQQPEDQRPRDGSEDPQPPMRKHDGMPDAAAPRFKLRVGARLVGRDDLPLSRPPDRKSVV